MIFEANKANKHLMEEVVEGAVGGVGMLEDPVYLKVLDDLSAQALSDTVLCPKCDKNVEEKATVVTKAKKKVCQQCYATMLANHARKQFMSLRSTGNRVAETEKVLILYDFSETATALISLCRDAVLRNDEVDLNPRGLDFPFEFSILVILEPMSIQLGGGHTLKNQLEMLGYLLMWCRWAKIKNPGLQDYKVYVSSIEMSLSTNTPKIRRVVHPNETNEIVNSPVDGIVAIPFKKVSAPFDKPGATKLLTFTGKLTSSTHRTDMRNLLRWNLFKHATEELSCKKVFLPDDQDIAGTNMISMMSLGRGAQIAPKMSITEEWRGITIGRPLLNFMTHELKSYLGSIPNETFFGLYFSSKPNSPGPGGRDIKKQVDTIQQKCAEFIGQLDKDFPATVSTLAGIGTKLDQAGGSEQGPKKKKGKGNKSKISNGHLDGVHPSGSKESAGSITSETSQGAEVSSESISNSENGNSQVSNSSNFICAVCKGVGEPVSKRHPDCCFGCVQLLDKMGTEEVKWVRGLGGVID